jgi:hypothetical protein
MQNLQFPSYSSYFLSVQKFLLSVLTNSTITVTTVHDWGIWVLFQAKAEVLLFSTES